MVRNTLRDFDKTTNIPKITIDTIRRSDEEFGNLISVLSKSTELILH
jgi:hypothetical protein